MNQVQARKIKCPICKKETVFSPENPFRPFCSERCRLIDLGEWASGTYAVPVQEQEYVELIDEQDENDQKDQS